MRGEIIGRLLDGLQETAARLPDKRQASNGLKYEVSDAVGSGFAVFYFQHRSMLDFQEAMESKRKRNNLRALFGVERIPGTTQIKNIADEIEPADLYGAFERALAVAEERGIVERYRVLNGTIPVALDGTWYFSSKEIHCDHCLRKTTKGQDGATETLYYHDMVAATSP